MRTRPLMLYIQAGRPVILQREAMELVDFFRFLLYNKTVLHTIKCAYYDKNRRT